MNNPQIGRLAMRQEGGNWNAYYALNETMNDAIFLGSIKMAAIIGKPERKAAFMNIMRDVVADVFEDAAGTTPVWGGETMAPEHEKSGNA